MSKKFFASNTTMYYIEKKIKQVKQVKQVKQLLNNIEPTKNHHFLSLLQQRIDDFTQELLRGDISQSDKQLVLEQFNRFAQTILYCLHSPSYTMDFIANYHEQFYYPVGIKDASPPSELIYDLTAAAITLSISLAIGSLAAFLVNPIAGAIMLAVGVTMLLPSGYSLLIPQSPDTIKKKEEEKELFLTAAHLIKPSETLNEVKTEKIELPCFA